MRELDKALDRDEEILWEGAPNFWPFVAKSFITFPFGLVFFAFASLWYFSALSFAGSFPFGGIFSLVGLFFMIIPVFIMFGPPIYSILSHKHTYYAITDKRVLMQRGVIGRDFEIVDFDKITNVEVDVGFFDKLLSDSSGSVIISSAGTMTYARAGGAGIFPYTLSSIPNPYEVFRLFKKVSHDVKTDIFFPNVYRPGVNIGYKTKYRAEKPEVKEDEKEKKTR